MSRAWQIDRHIDREVTRLLADFNSGLITRADYKEGLRELQREVGLVNRQEGIAEADAKIAAREEHIRQLIEERDEARYVARCLAHAYQHDIRPLTSALMAVRAWEPVVETVKQEPR